MAGTAAATEEKERKETHELMTTLDLLFCVVALRRGDGNDDGEQGEAGARDERVRGEGGMAEKGDKGEEVWRGRKCEGLFLFSRDRLFLFLLFYSKKRIISLPFFSLIGNNRSTLFAKPGVAFECCSNELWGAEGIFPKRRTGAKKEKKSSGKKKKKRVLEKKKKKKLDQEYLPIFSSVLSILSFARSPPFLVF